MGTPSVTDDGQSYVQHDNDESSDEVKDISSYYIDFTIDSACYPT